jgi:hypothetical protein
MAFAKRSFPAILKLVTGAILLLSLAAVFILSGWSKLQTIEPFAWSFIDILPVTITTASVIAHLFIGLEWLIGAWLLAHLFLRRVTYKATIGLLLLLSVYLAGMIVVEGNNGNCGCFGEWLYMKPAAAIWKNVIMMAVVALLWFIYPSRPYKGQLYVAVFLAVAAFTAPFVLEPVRIHGSGEKVSEAINLTPLYEYGSPAPAIDLKKGKHIVCFFSTTCPHCKKGAYLLQILHRRYPALPLFMALNGTESLKKSFLAETKSGDVPQTVLSNTPAFTSMAGEYVPAIYWINNSVIERKSYYTELEPGAIRQWLQQK